MASPRIPDGARSPDFADRYAQAAALGEAGRIDEAIAAFESILREDPRAFDAANNRAVYLARSNRFVEAIAGFEGALGIRPDSGDAWANRGLALAKIGRREEGLASFLRAVELQPGLQDAVVNAADLLFSLARPAEALAMLDRLDPARRRRPDVLMMEGNHLSRIGKFADALACYDAILAAEPAHPDALHNRGTMLDKLLRIPEALECYDRVLAADPLDPVGTMLNRAVVLSRLHRQDEALAGFEEALVIRPDSASAHMGAAVVHLRLGDYARGFRRFQWRWLEPTFGEPRRDFGRPLWTGRRPLAGKSILVHAEQGLGDILQFIRYVPMLAERGAFVVLEVPPPLLPLVAGLKGVGKLLAAGEALPATDYQIPLLSLPLAFGTTLKTVPANVPYLSVAPDAAAAWREKLAAPGERLVGVCWRGNPGYRSDFERSIRFADFAPLLTMPGIRFVNLQKEMTDEERHLCASLPMVHPALDFRNTAELVAALDLVISVDTSWAHWAGAIGRPLWVLLAHTPHWAWLMDRSDSPWYPTARLFRQPAAGDWKSVIREARAAFATRAGSKGKSRARQA